MRSYYVSLFKEFGNWLLAMLAVVIAGAIFGSSDLDWQNITIDVIINNYNFSMNLIAGFMILLIVYIINKRRVSRYTDIIGAFPIKRIKITAAEALFIETILFTAGILEYILLLFMYEMNPQDIVQLTMSAIGFLSVVNIVITIFYMIISSNTNMLVAGFVCFGGYISLKIILDGIYQWLIFSTSYNGNSLLRIIENSLVVIRTPMKSITKAYDLSIETGDYSRYYFRYSNSELIVWYMIIVILAAIVSACFLYYGIKKNSEKDYSSVSVNPGIINRLAVILFVLGLYLQIAVSIGESINKSDNSYMVFNCGEFVYSTRSSTLFYPVDGCVIMLGAVLIAGLILFSNKFGRKLISESKKTLVKETKGGIK